MASQTAGGPGRMATIYDVAREAGVSHQTVSRYLRGETTVRPSTGERVQQALDALDYRPNHAAKALTTGRSRRLGALTHELGRYGPSQVLQGASSAAVAAGYVLDIVTVDMSDAAAIERALDALSNHDLAGVLALASTDEMLRAFTRARFRTPFSIVSEPDEPDEPGQATSELSATGIPELIAHLADLGHRRFLHLGGPGTWSAARNRAKAFSSAIERLGLESAGVLEGDWSAQSGHALLSSYPAQNFPTAVVAANDQMALGALLALAERGLGVPQEVSVTGMDDTPEAAYFQPPLTTIRLDFISQGHGAVQELLGRVDPDAAPVERGRQGARLVLRNSTGPVVS